MASITTTALAFFEACERGDGWEVCRAHCAPDATFASQAEPLLDIATVADYAEWMKGMISVLPDARYDLKSVATDTERNNVATYAVFHATHTGEGGPVETSQSWWAARVAAMWSRWRLSVVSP